MALRPHLHADPADQYGELIGRVAQSARSTKTGEHGVAHLGAGDVIWDDPATGVEQSVKAIPSVLDHLSTGLSTTSRMNTVATVAPGDPTGFPDGAFWTQVNAGPPMVEVDRWTIQGGQWVRVGLDAGRLVTGKVDAGLVDAVGLAALFVTAGLLRTAESGQRWEITGDGIVMYGVGDDGEDVEMVRLGPTAGSNLISVGTSTVSPDGVTADTVEASTVRIGGTDILDTIDQQNRLVGWYQAVTNSAWHSGSTEVSRVQVTCTLQPGRMYRVSVNSHYVNARSAAVNIVENLRWDYWSATGGVTASSPTIASGRFTVTAGDATIIPGLSGMLFTTEWTAPRTVWVMLRTVGGGSDTQHIASGVYPLAVYVEDLGPTVNPSGRSWMNLGVAANNGTQTAPPAEAEVQSYTKTYTSTGWRTFNQDGSDAKKSDVVHGLYGGGPTSQTRRGGWLFPSMTGDLAGATITGVKIFIPQCTQTWSSTGSTVNLALWGGTMATSLKAFTSIYGYKQGPGRWFNVPSNLWAGFKSGAVDGTGVIPTSSSTVQYARFAGTGAKIQVSYRK